MTDFTSTSGNDNFVATSGPDRFFFGENQGVDLIVNFDPSQDKLVYTDRSVDGFDDLGISQLSNGDTAVESNDQVTVLQGIKPSQLRDSDFVFTTSGKRYTIDRARENNDVPNEVSVRDINQREAQINGSGGGSTGNSGGSTGNNGGSTGNTGGSNHGGGFFGGLLSDFLHQAVSSRGQNLSSTQTREAGAVTADPTGGSSTRSGLFSSLGQDRHDGSGLLASQQHNSHGLF